MKCRWQPWLVWSSAKTLGLKAKQQKQKATVSVLETVELSVEGIPTEIGIIK